QSPSPGTSSLSLPDALPIWMAHHAERSALDQLMIFFNRHVHGKKATECDDGPPAQKQSSDKEHHAGERKASLMRQCRRRPMFRQDRKSTRLNSSHEWNSYAV